MQSLLRLFAVFAAFGLASCLQSSGRKSQLHQSLATCQSGGADRARWSWDTAAQSPAAALESVLADVRSSAAASSDSAVDESARSAIRDFSSKEEGSDGEKAWKFLRGVAASAAFASHFWHKKPLLIRAKDTGGWVEGAFSVTEHLRLVDGSYITGHKTAEALRNGTATDTWQFLPIKADPARPTTWREVEDALRGGTIYFNSAGGLWPTLGALCRLTSYAFGIPSNVNLYVTPPGLTTSVPPHTDRQDVLVFHTAGAKRWRVFAPPKRSPGSDPLNRGKNGDVLAFHDMGEPLLDTVLRKGDVLYVPTGFPHTTDTCTVVDMNDDEVNDSDEVFDEISVHLTMGLDTHVWALTFAHLRWTLLQRCGKDFHLKIENDDAYWHAMETIPIGFLAGERWHTFLQTIQKGGKMDPDFKSTVVKQLKQTMVELEPNRWQSTQREEENAADGERDLFPSDSEFEQVIDYIIRDHLIPLMEIQEHMFSDLNPHDDDTILKAFHCTQKQNAIMERYGEFSKNAAMANSFAQQRLERDEQIKNLQ